MNRFSQIRIFLDSAVHGRNIGAHGPFWRGVTRDAFLGIRVFGANIIEPGNGDGSPMVRALRGDGYPQMPSGFPPLPEEQIAFIAQWIDDGCPDELVDPMTIEAEGEIDADAELHNAYWREFDNWSAFRRTNEIEVAIGESFGLARQWMRWSRGEIDEPTFKAAVRHPETEAAIALLARRQAETIQSIYGNPTPIKTLFESYTLFGRGTDNGGLPEDPLRAGDPHQMNGPQMWFNWCTMADAAMMLQSPVQAEFWPWHMRAILIGLMMDGLIRNRFPVDGFDRADPDLSAKIEQHVRSLSDEQLGPEMRTRFGGTSFRLPFQSS